jgi:hypothetical protein
MWGISGVTPEILKGKIINLENLWKILCDINAVLYAAGGIAGAEGSVCLLLEGDKNKLETALKLVNEKVQGESAFVAEVAKTSGSPTSVRFAQ